jgi:uncharacterized protein (TIGR02302 family)
MKYKNVKYKSLPIYLIIKINLARLIIIWENFSNHLYRALLVSVLFTIITLMEGFSYLPYLLHGLVIISFLLCFLAILAYFIFSFKWPSNITCARRIEKDNKAKNMPFSSLFDSPIQNENSLVWNEHYKRILNISRNLSLIKIKFLHFKNDPLFTRLPIVILFVFVFMAFNSDLDKKVQAALTPENNNIEIQVGIFTGWINPPEYTKLQPALIKGEDDALMVPIGSSLSARVFGGKGKVELGIYGETQDFINIDNENAVLESILDKDTDLIIKQNQKIIFKKQLKILNDNAPLVDFVEEPKSTIKGVMDINYIFSDDYDVTKLFAKIILKKPIESLEIQDITFKVPFTTSSDNQTLGQYYHDLSEHIWAGLPVKIMLIAEDYIGQKGLSRELEILLPEKPFKNLIAISIINQRKNLSLNKVDPFEVGKALIEVSEAKLFEEKLPEAQDWLLESSNILLESKDNLMLTDKKKSFVVDLLWKTALYIESGQLSVAENELRRAQQDLEEALSQGGDGAEIQDMMDNLDNALAKYLDELENPMDIDVPQVSEADDPGDRGGENGAQSSERENLEEKLEDIAELTASGSLDEAQEQLDQMQEMSEGLDRDALGEALGEQETDSAPMAMQQISEMMQEQEALMEDSFEQSLNAAQADQKTPGSGPVNAGQKQESLRKQLEDVMHEINESDNPLPVELGRAERSMRQAEKELQRGRPDRAQAAQGRAIEQLKKAAEKLDKMHSGNGPSQMAGDSNGNSDRDQRDPLGRAPPGQGNSPGGDVGITMESDSTKAKKIVKELYKKAESSVKGSIERNYVDSLLDWY